MRFCSLLTQQARSLSTGLKSHKRGLGSLSSTDLKGKRVLVRTDFNVPLDKTTGQITNDKRIRAHIDTIKYLSDAGARVVLCSHMGRPKGQVNEAMRLAPVAQRLADLISKPVTTSADCIGEEVRNASSNLGDGEILLLENLRFHKAETDNDTSFCKQLVEDSGAEVYVNDAFGTAHRAHASTAGVTDFVQGPKVAGFLLEKEILYLDGAIKAPKRPLTAIVGGAKVSTKITVLEALLEKCDKLIIGGAMIFTFFRSQKINTGNSLVEEEFIPMAEHIISKAEEKGVELILPVDVKVASEFSNDADNAVVDSHSIPDGWLGLDIGPKSIDNVNNALDASQTIIWNGPMGAFEMPEFAAGTLGVADRMGALTETGVLTIVGGGDSVAAVEGMGLAPKMSHISTGGGACLEMLEGKQLPGVECLDDN